MRGTLSLLFKILLFLLILLAVTLLVFKILNPSKQSLMNASETGSKNLEESLHNLSKVFE